jgi:hypothetical protein
VVLHCVRRDEESFGDRAGDEPLAEAWNQGRALTTDEAVALALASPAPNGAG